MLKQQVDASYDSAHWMFCQRLRYKTLNRPKIRSGKATSRRDRNSRLYCYAEVTNVQEELLWLFAVRFLLKGSDQNVKLSYSSTQRSLHEP